jgi:hypothetical protein
MSEIFDLNQAIIGLNIRQARDLMQELQKRCAKTIRGTTARFFDEKIATKAIRRTILTDDKNKINYKLSCNLDKKADEITPYFLQLMSAEGLIKKDLNGSKYFNYRITSKGISLSRHKFLPPLSKASADELVFKLLDYINDTEFKKSNPLVKNIWMLGDIVSKSDGINRIEFVCEFYSCRDYLPDGFLSSVSHHLFCSGEMDAMEKVSKYFYFHPLRPFSLKYTKNNYALIVKDKKPVPEIELLLSKPKAKAKKITKKEPTSLKWFFMGMMREPDSLYFHLDFYHATSLIYSIYKGNNYFHDIGITEEELDANINWIAKEFSDNEKNKGITTPFINDLSESIKKKIISDWYILKTDSKLVLRPEPKFVPLYKLTEKAYDLFVFKQAPLLSINKAKTILDKLIKNINNLNKSNSAYTVKNAWLYGDMAADSDEVYEVGDIEIICEFEKHQDAADYPDKSEIDYMESKGKYQFKKTESLLKKGLPRINFTRFSAEHLIKIKSVSHCIQIIEDHEIIYTVPK